MSSRDGQLGMRVQKMPACGQSRFVRKRAQRDPGERRAHEIGSLAVSATSSPCVDVAGFIERERFAQAGEIDAERGGGIERGLSCPVPRAAALCRRSANATGRARVRFRADLIECPAEPAAEMDLRRRARLCRDARPRDRRHQRQGKAKTEARQARRHKSENRGACAPLNRPALVQFSVRQASPGRPGPHGVTHHNMCQRPRSSRPRSSCSSSARSAQALADLKLNRYVWSVRPIASAELATKL